MDGRVPVIGICVPVWAGQNVRTLYMAIPPGRIVSALQEIAGSVGSAPGLAAAPAAAVHLAGKKFSDGDLHARLSVPGRGGTRAGRDKKRAVLAGRATRPDCGDVDYGCTVSPVGRNSDRRGACDPKVSSRRPSTIPAKAEPAYSGEHRMRAARSGLFPGRSKMGGHAALHFTRACGAGGLEFDPRAECDAHGIGDERRNGMPRRGAITHGLRRAG